MTRIGAALAALLLASCGGGTGGEPAISVHDATARAPIAGRTETVAYFVVTNTGAAPDALLGVSTPAGAASVHSTAMDNGVMRMRPAARVVIAPHSSLAFGPGSYHVMLTGLRQPLEPGATFPMTLAFQKSGQRQISVKVGAPGGHGAGH